MFQLDFEKHTRTCDPIIRVCLISPFLTNTEYLSEGVNSGRQGKAKKLFGGQDQQIKSTFLNEPGQKFINEMHPRENK